MKNQPKKSLQQGFFIIGIGLVLFAISGVTTAVIVNNNDQATNAVGKQVMSTHSNNTVISMNQ